MANKVKIHIFVTVILSLKFCSTLVAGGSCRDFTFGDCQKMDNFETVNDVNETVCQQYCSDVYNDRCTFFVFDFEQQFCQIFDTIFEDFSGECLSVGGPKSPPQQQCKSTPCNVSIPI